ncbi:MAG: hypothetical protein K5634_02965 [Sphaerochaetaceae bacterium]|nr:hypothetical protein [Sphaerochaetaceae bacterium]
MENLHSESIKVNIGNSDATLHLSLPAMMTCFQDIATEHAQLLGIGFKDMSDKGLVWVTTKTMVDIEKSPSFLSDCTVSTMASEIRNGRAYREYTISVRDKVCVKGKSEWTALDIKTGRPVSAETVMPELEYVENRVCPSDFRMIDHDFSNAEVLGVCKVRSTDIDFIGHMNNIAYVRSFQSLFTVEQLKKNPFRHFEISYVSSCYEGNEIEYRIRGNEVCGTNLKTGKPCVFIYFL